MTEVERNLAVTRQIYALWSGSRGEDSAPLLELMTEDIRWGSLASGAPGAEFTVDTVGKQGVRDYLSALVAGWSMDYHELDELIADRDRVIALSHCGWTNRATGKSIRTPKCDVFRFRDGKIAEFYEYYDTARLRGAASHDPEPEPE